MVSSSLEHSGVSHFSGWHDSSDNANLNFDAYTVTGLTFSLTDTTSLALNAQLAYQVPHQQPNMHNWHTRYQLKHVDADICSSLL